MASASLGAGNEVVDREVDAGKVDFAESANPFLPTVKIVLMRPVVGELALDCSARDVGAVRDLTDETAQLAFDALLHEVQGERRTVAADALPAKALGCHQGRRTFAERIEHGIALVGGCAEDELQVCHWLLGRIVATFLARSDMEVCPQIADWNARIFVRSLLPVRLAGRRPMDTVRRIETIQIVPGRSPSVLRVQSLPLETLASVKRCGPYERRHWSLHVGTTVVRLDRRTESWLLPSL